MEFPYTYFEDEIREGFYISGMIKRSWAAQIEVLQEIDKVCKKHNIKWFADCGTLLGTVRHGGYIPWDDDLDICMLRPDYIRFNQVAEKELPKDYVVLNVHKYEEDYFEHMTRVSNGHRLNFDEDYLEKYHNCPYATGIDIFPLDYIADDEEEEQERKDLLSLLMPLADEIEDDGSNVKEYMDVIRQVEDICKVKIDTTKYVKHQLFEVTEKIFALYSDCGGKHVALMPYWVYFNNHKYLAEYFDEAIMMPFEITEIPVPSAYDAVLSIEYGDYMKIRKGGGVHEYPCYEKQENYLIDLLDDYPFKYKFDDNDLKNDERNPGYKQQIVDFVGMMNEAHSAIIAMLSANQYEMVNNLLMACQESAIQIGNLIEDRFGEGYTTVKVLEEYCEIIYQVGQLVEEASATGELSISIADIEGYLNEISDGISNSIEINIINKKEVLFVVVKADEWDALDSVWRPFADDPNVNVKVMPIPYFERSAMGAAMTWHYEGSYFPDYVNVIDYRNYNIEKKHPDIIIVQNAYDRCNYTTSVMPQYYTKNLKKDTDKLVYIPWFKLDELDYDSAKARKTMQYYCYVPGVIESDVVILQSEQTRQAYIEYWCEQTSDENRNIYEQKFLAIGSPLDDSIGDNLRKDKKELLKEFPDEWREILIKGNGEFKKIVFYNTTVASYMQNGVGLFDKIEEALAKFKDYKDEIAVIWHPHLQLRTIIATKYSSQIHKYDRITREFIESGLGVIDKTGEIDKVLSLCDAYYGDIDGIAHKCEMRGIPIMIQAI